MKAHYSLTKLLCAFLLFYLNNSIKTFEMAKPTYADKIAMIDSFTKLYKENELGYPINLEEKVEDRQRSLKNLKYGGYGEEELKSFISRCKNTITDKTNKGVKVNEKKRS